jgi:hypothetical protein
VSLQVYIRNAALRRVAEAADRSKLEFTLADCDVGPWSVTLPAASAAALALTYRGGIEVWRKDDDHPERPAQYLMSGSPTKMTVSSRRLQRRQVVEELTVQGEDDNALLRTRLALPSPLSPAGGPYTQDYDDHSGPVETVARGFVDRNLGPSAVASRRIPDLILDPDLARGPNVRGIPDRYTNLLPFLQELVTGTGVSFRVVQVGQQRVLRFYEGRDLSAQVVFGIDRGNLLSYSYATTAPDANYLYAGGQGDLAARQIVEGADLASVESYGRREGFLDERSAPDATYLTQKIGGQLVERGANSGLTIEPIDGPDSRLGLDYWLADIVSVRLRDPHGNPASSGSQTAATITDRVLAVKVTEDEHGRESLSPIVASDGANLTGLSLVPRLRRVFRSVTRLESR